MPMILSGLLTLRRRFLRQVQNEREHGEGSINYVENVEEALQGANVCFIFTEWGEIKAVKSEDYQRLMRTPLVYDGRNIYGEKI